MAILFGRNQFSVFLSFLVCGVLAGILFDILKIKRHIFGTQGLLLFFDDLLFMLICGILLIFNAFAFNDGNFKWYEVPFMIAGFCVYRLTVSRWVIYFLFAAIDWIKKLLFQLLRPIIRLARKIGYRILWLLQQLAYHIRLYFLKKRMSRCYPLPG